MKAEAWPGTVEGKMDNVGATAEYGHGSFYFYKRNSKRETVIGAKSMVSDVLLVFRTKSDGEAIGTGQFPVQPFVSHTGRGQLAAKNVHKLGNCSRVRGILRRVSTSKTRKRVHELMMTR